MKKSLFILLTITLLGCEVQTELSDSIYIPDSEFPELPAYTEWGYNTFGSNFDRSVFIYSYDEIPFKVSVNENELSFIFHGTKGSYSYNYLALRITIPDSVTINYQDLLVYNDTILDLTRNDVTVEMIENGNIEIIDILEGELNFIRSQRVFIDDLEQQIILSGYFELKYILNNIPSTMSDGRFDFGVNNENFYDLNGMQSGKK